MGMREPALVGDPPSAWGGRSWYMWKEAAMVALPLAHHLTMAFCFYCIPRFLHNHSQLRTSSLLSPQAFSLQPTVVLSQGFLSKSQVPTPSPHLHLQTHVSGWGAHSCGMDHLCKSHFILPATDRLLHSPSIAPEAPLLSQLISPLVRGLPRMWEPLLSFGSPYPWVPVLSCFLSSSFFPSFFFHYSYYIYSYYIYIFFHLPSCFCLYRYQ